MRNVKIRQGLLVIILVLLISGCGGGGGSTTPAPQAPPSPPAQTGGTAPQEGTATEPAKEKPVFTLEELAKFDGREGRPAYVAVEGIVYDVSGSSRWRNGRHNGFDAGKDLTREIKEVSPHGVKVLERMPVVGTLKTE